jgi:hypothetical protein
LVCTCKCTTALWSNYNTAVWLGKTLHWFVVRGKHCSRNIIASWFAAWLASVLWFCQRYRQCVDNYFSLCFTDHSIGRRCESVTRCQ